METLLNKFHKKLSHYSRNEKKQIITALDLATELHKNQFRKSGSPYITHPISVALMLIEMKMDYQTIIAAILHDVLEDTDFTHSKIEKIFGSDIANLVEGVTKISKVITENKSEQEAESIRKMLIAMVSDIRVILIKLTDKIHNLKTIEHLPPNRQKSYAYECLNIFAPLAERLGISWMKLQIENLALKTLNPEIYQQIKDSIDSNLIKYKDYFSKLEYKISKLTKTAGYKISILTRAKHIYSIYKKMRKRNLGISEIFDIFGIRIICKEENECYAILGIIHSNFTPLEGKFKDYIGMPKANRYQSIHTTVMCENGMILEVQIRTEEMHKKAEYGVAAHWAYKRNIKIESVENSDLVIINKMRSWNNKDLDSKEFLKEIQEDLLKDSIYVFTPAGQILELPSGSTPLDFAYHIHSEVGNSCIGAKCNGKIIPLNANLKNSQIIQIITSKKAHPNENWLKIVKTSGAKNKIKQWLNKNKNSMTKEENLAKEKKIREKSEEKIKPEIQKQVDNKNFLNTNRLNFSIGQDKNILTRIATCCAPMPGDDIIGYISLGRGIIIHKRSCKNLANIKNIENRQIDVDWSISSPKKLFTIKILSTRGSDIFTELEKSLKNYSGTILRANIENLKEDLLTGKFVIEISDIENFKKFKKEFSTLPFIKEIS